MNFCHVLLGATLGIAVASASAGAVTSSKWKLTTVKDLGKLESLCDGEEKFSVIADEFEMADIFQQGPVTVTICHAKGESLNFMTEEYMIKANMGSKSIPLHMETGVMAFGAEALPVGSDFKISLYWPSDLKQKRKVREFQITCKDQCVLAETCAIQHLKTDLPLDQLLATINAKTKTKAKKNFFLNFSKEDSQQVDQLFIEALAGSTKAKSTLEKLMDGNNTAAVETIGTYGMYLTDMASLKCHWREN